MLSLIFGMFKINWLIFLLEIMPKKHTIIGPSKRPRVEEIVPDVDLAPVFHTQMHQEYFTHLSRWCFDELREIDWDVLRDVGLEEEVSQLLNVSAWR